MRTKLHNLNGQNVRLSETEDVEPDECTKIFHELVDATTGATVKTIDWSPYDHMVDEDVELYIALGWPSRAELGSHGPLRTKDLLKIREIQDARKHAARIMKEAPDVEL